MAGLGGGGSVADNVNVSSGVLQPGITPEEVAVVTEVPVTADNVLDVGGDLRIARQGRFVPTISGDRDYTSVAAAGDLVLDGDLVVDVQGDPTQGTELKIMERSRAPSTGSPKGLS